MRVRLPLVPPKLNIWRYCVIDIRYRIGIINDFQDSFSFISYKVYGRLEIYDASRSAGNEKIQDAKIYVFLNLKKVGEFKSKSEAVSMVRRLIAEAPCSWFEENKDILLEDLC